MSLFDFQPRPEAARPDTAPVPIQRLEKAALLQALHAPAIRMDGADHRTLTREQAEAAIERRLLLGAGLHFKILAGRTLDVDIAGDYLDPTGYDAASRIHPDDGRRDLSAARGVAEYLRKELTRG